MAYYEELDMLFMQHINRRMARYNRKQYEHERAKKSDYEKGLMDGEEHYSGFGGWYGGFNQDVTGMLKEAGERYNLLKNKKSKTEYERGYFEALRYFISAHAEEYHVRGVFKREGLKVEKGANGKFKITLGGTMEPLPAVGFRNIKRPPGAPEEPAQELVSSNKRRKVSIDWTEDDEKLIYSAVKKYTRDFTSLPAGYTREDVLQEAAQAWARRLINKGGHDTAKGKKSTLLYKVVQNTIQDLIKAANTDKRKVIQHTGEFNDVYAVGWDGDIIGPDNKEHISDNYEGGEGSFKPTRRGEKDIIKWKRESQSKAIQDDIEP